jgi:HEAT repeat protein
MLSELVQALVQSKNEAADDVLLDALRLGSDPEKALALNALLRRKTLKGMAGVIALYNALPNPIQLTVLHNVGQFHHSLRDCARGRNPEAAVAAMKLIAQGHQGKLAYVLLEGLHGNLEAVSRGACEALVALSRWAATETRRLQTQLTPAASSTEATQIYQHLMEDRPEIEHAIARAMDVHRGKFGPDLLRAALLLADSPLSKTLAILQTQKHGGQTAMVRRLQQPPDSEHAEAFLLGASHGGLRSHFGVVFSHIAEPPVLDALLRRTHWLKDQQLQLCMHQVSRGIWWSEADLDRDLARRDDEDASRVAEWIAASGVHDVVQDERILKVRSLLGGYLPGRLRLLRLAMRRPRASSVGLLRSFLADPDERLARLAAREIVRRRPPDYENILIQAMASSPESVRRIIARSVGQVGFENFWERFDRMDKSTRRSAGRAMLKVLPDGMQRLERKLRAGSVEQRMKAVTMAQELGVADALANVLMQVCADANPKLRSKAVGLLAEVQTVTPDAVLEKALNDVDPRVRANAVEVLENKHRVDFVPLLTKRARSSNSRERANAIKAMHRMRVETASSQLVNMMQDERPDHRISALWAMKQIGFWQMLREVAGLAKDDPNMRVRRYAAAILKSLADIVKENRAKQAS